MPTPPSLQMLPWSSFRSYVLPNVKGCPIQIVDNAIKDAAIEFCERSEIWQVGATPIDLVAYEPRYGFVPPEDARVSKTTNAFLRIKPSQIIELRKTTRDNLDTYEPGWRTMEASYPTRYFMDTPNSIRVLGIPTETIPDSLWVLSVLKPTRLSTTGPDFLFEDWVETIAAGALKRLHAMEGRIWANTTLVGYYDKKFREGTAKAKIKAIKSYQQLTNLMKPANFGGTY